MNHPVRANEALPTPSRSLLLQIRHPNPAPCEALMETPSSIRGDTRTQFALASQKTKQDASRSRSSRKMERTVLFDISNDSPIVGLASDGLVEKTPASSAGKNWAKTPGSGEALLRGQVKMLLRNVEQEAGNANKISSSHHRPRPGALLGFVVSPAQLLAPTPANTPQVPNLSAVRDGVSVVPREVVEEQEDSQENLTRALLFDSPEKSEASDESSSLTFQGSKANYQDKSPEDDNSSARSLQVNASIQEEEEEEEEEEAEAEEEESFDELCAELMNMSVKDEERLPEFTGKHTRFVYNSDDEIEGEEEVGDDGDRHKKQVLLSPNVVLLKGVPLPEGKHLRFQDEEEE